MSDLKHSRVRRSQAALSSRRWLLAAAGVALFHLCWMLSGKEDGLWLPGLGVGLALVAWLGRGVLILLFVDLLWARTSIRPDKALAYHLGDCLLITAELGLSWWLYAGVARGTRRLDDPRSATTFLILVPGAVAAGMASMQALFRGWAFGVDEPFWTLASALWISRALGILALAPALLVVITPLLVRAGLTRAEPPSRLPGGSEPQDWRTGEIIETTGLCLGAGILALSLVSMHIYGDMPAWTVWGFCLLLVVWTSLRQGLRGGSLAASTSAVFALVSAVMMDISVSDFTPLQGNLLAQCSTALLVGASAGWIRASEMRYRQMVGHIPVVLYSSRLPRGLAIPLGSLNGQGMRTARVEDLTEVPPARLIVEQAEVTLVSPACDAVFHCPPEDLLGPYAAWIERIDESDRELVRAALAQLCLQKQPVTCEYRIVVDPTDNNPNIRWVRDTLVPYHATETSLDGWDGVIEDITEQRALSQSLRRSNGMLQALVTYLPTGVFFVQGPIGQPILVNQRARQLLGQREELAAGIAHLSQVYRLHRPDGSEYPADELPVTKALRQGMTSMANDIVVHRPDGRRIPLITWAAPVNWTGTTGRPDAAVWVLEDLTALQQAETARRESEARLRGVIETMAEGVIVQNRSGAILECNPAACTILGESSETLLGRTSLGPDDGCLREDGTPFPRNEQPDRKALSSGAAVRNVIMGVPVGNGAAVTMRWIFVNAMPLPVGAAGTAMMPNSKGARVVTTFADITAHRQALSELERAQRLELVGRLASGTVHDFNNLLTAMMGLAGLVQSMLPDSHPAQHDLARLLDAGEQASHLAGQMLAFSKQKKPVLHGVDLNTVVVHSLKLLKGTLAHDIHVEHRLEGDVLLVHGDETQLKQVAMNLCLNARDAMTRGGNLTVTTARDGTGWVRLSVEDTGHGMDEAIQQRMFEPFFSTKEHGTGLGLAVVRQIVEGLGGRLEVFSKPDVGTRMDVYLRAHL